MIASLFAILLASAQPAPAEEPVVTDAEAQTEVQADVQAEVQAPVEPATPVAVETQVAVTAEAEAEAEAAPAAPEEEIVCRRRVIPAERIGQRMRTVRDCRPASEWPSSRRRGGA
ncbi:MAG TPA: hypothetical protein VF552_05680 [Allosphingosinicella sp.]|jgi:hypothetical protein